MKSFNEFINEGKLSADNFEKELKRGKHIQIKDDTLWLNSDNEWMFNMKKSDFKTVYGMYKKNTKDAILSEAKGDTEFHKYSKNSLEELELLLKHHKEDLEEGDCDKEAITKDIEEIEGAIEAKKIEKVDEAAEINYKSLVRYIPTGSKVQTSISGKSMKIMIINPISAPPLTTKDIPGAEKRLIKDVDNFIGDVESVIKIKRVEKDTYVFIKGVDKGIELIFEFSIVVNSAPELKKLGKLDEALSFYKEK